MRDTTISFRVEPETARGLVWLTNKYNFEHTASKTKTDIIDALIMAAVKRPELLEEVLQ